MHNLLQTKLGAVLVNTGSRLNLAVSQVLQWLVRLYQLTLSPLIGNQCRFHPTCSHYAMEALQRHGPWRGSWMAAKRLGRCHPFTPGGVDEVPNPLQRPLQQQLQPHVEEAL